MRPWLPLLLALPAGPALAQAPLSFGVSSARVEVAATAVDGSGRPITNLRAPEFRILENGKPQPLTYFAGGETAPARVLVLVDASGSMGAKDRPSSARMAAVQVLSGLGARDEAALATFDETYRMVVEFTPDRKALLRGLDAVASFGSTALYDAVMEGARDLANQAEGRRALIVLTDGIDTSSTRTPEEVLALAKAVDVPVYAVSVLSPIDDPASPLYAGRVDQKAVRARDLLAQHARLTGGEAFVVSNLKGVLGAARQILSEMRYQYRLGYDPPPGPPGFRRIEVRTTRKGVRVRTRNGYLSR